MTKRNVIIAVVIIVAAFFLSAPAKRVVERVKEGKVVGRHSLGADGLVKEDPAALAAAAGYPLTVYALASMLTSEGGSGPYEELRARAWVAVNDSRKAPFSGNLVRCLTYRRDYSGQRFGEQGAYRGRYATSKAPTERTLEIARKVLSGELADNTGGAVKFVDINSFGRQPGTRTYPVVAAEWAREGLRPFSVNGARPDFVVFRKVV